VSLGNLGSTGVTLLNNTSTTREDDKSGLVTLQAINVQVQGLLALVSSSVVNRNSHGLGKLSVDASGLKKTSTIKIRHAYNNTYMLFILYYLQLLQSETSAKLDLGVVLKLGKQTQLVIEFTHNSQ